MDNSVWNLGEVMRGWMVGINCQGNKRGSLATWVPQSEIFKPDKVPYHCSWPVEIYSVTNRNLNWDGKYFREMHTCGDPLITADLIGNYSKMQIISDF